MNRNAIPVFRSTGHRCPRPRRCGPNGCLNWSGSEERDYVLKREEYLDFGVREYWIVDADRREVLVLRRRGQQWTERVVAEKERYTTKSLPGFKLDVAAIFRAADRAS
ncbi:MAG: Uma2 family endonuclease [Gemmataceae bacterium]